MKGLYVCSVCVCASMLYDKDSIEIVILKIYHSDSHDNNNGVVCFQ